MDNHAVFCSVCLGRAVTDFLLLLKDSFQVDVFALTKIPAALWGCDSIGAAELFEGYSSPPPPSFCLQRALSLQEHPCPLTLLLTPSFSSRGCEVLTGGTVVQGSDQWGFHVLYLFPSGASQGSGPSKYSACISFLWMCPPGWG